MKKKLMITMLSTLILTFSIVTTLFVIIENYQYMQNTKENLRINNQIVINVLEAEGFNNKNFSFKNNFKNDVIRETLIDKKGKVLSDTIADAETMDNHNERKEVKDARKEGTGHSTRYSATLRKKTLYFATAFNDGYVVRSAIAMQIIKGIEMSYLKYYIIAMMFSIMVSIIFASKLSHTIVKPIKELEFTTSSIASGKFDKRVRISSKDEIGQLGITFNNMADKLNSTLNEVLDKQNKLEAILKSMDSGVIAVDINYKIIMINPYAKKIFGISRDIIGENLMDNIRDFEFEDVFKNTDEDYTEIKILWPKERNLRIRTADIINVREKIGTVAVVQDITDIKKLENMRTQFVANVSHELKTPLTSIKGFAETLRYVDDFKNKEKFLNIINDEADRLTRLINDTLTLSHIENSIENKEEKIDVNFIIKDVCCLVKNSAEKKNIKVVTIGDELPNLKGDSDRFKQMLINLVDNAIKYSDNNGIVKIGTKVENNNCIIWVEDKGVGISKEHIDRIFERFYRIDKARSRAQGGTGLGLAIVKHIVMTLNGNIRVESEIGKGSKFILEIPIV
ncbi:HAMP domain-containing sensor histidine kinase [Clostridium scatologenes]|uniref:histidine kinase n=1 Tax=Clostridium scatologenes TaxID=1548 RepID=A0A0E3M8M3_CLOSL|nr:HAMP domain-containing sensor histidine kinase [Clostridium scatologenes]AKA69984.1 PAS domain S-box domain-containing protein [Clostridium scatologenes]